MPVKNLLAIREAMNQTCELGDERFKAIIEASRICRSAPLGRRGDRRLEASRERQVQCL